jgi:endonuclease/exonuclease/phosphatase family metal-dependent hydrolase
MKFLLALSVLMVSSTTFAKTLKIMQYNIENFFDTRHDPNTEDYVYLPLNVKNTIPGMNEFCAKQGSEFYIKECLNLDWNDNIVNRKLQGISQVIRSFDVTGRGADIIVIEEIENRNVLNMIATRAVGDLGYRFQALIEGDDSRGIDVAVLSKFPIVAANRYPLIVNGNKVNTRGILGVALNVDGNSVVVFANHWPSQSNPTQERIASAQLLANLANQTAQANPKPALIVAAGDFNTVAADQPSPFNFLGDFVDAEPQARRINRNLNPGTHFFRGEWTSLDHIWIHKSSTMRPRFDRLQIMNRPFMMKRDERAGVMVPNRFNAADGSGYSDHLPMTMEFEY